MNLMCFLRFPLFFNSLNPSYVASLEIEANLNRKTSRHCINNMESILVIDFYNLPRYFRNPSRNT
jgi:hypothetical protein